MSKLKLICINCNKEFERYQSQVKDVNNVCCSKSCYGEQLKIKLKGSNNPNFNNRWNDKQRNKQSILKKKQFNNNEVYRLAVGSANRGVKFSTERIEKCHGYRTKESYSFIMPEESKKIIGEKSSQKFTLEFKEQQRERMEKLGHWIPLKYKDDYNLYATLSNWKKRMWDYFDLTYINELGIYSKNNKKGLVRDHIFSRWDGFKRGVFPEILSHPCNCQIITHKENVSKEYKKSNKTLEDLFNDIISYKGVWFEQELCISLIKLFKNNKRYNRLEYEQKYYQVCDAEN